MKYYLEKTGERYTVIEQNGEIVVETGAAWRAAQICDALNLEYALQILLSACRRLLKANPADPANPTSGAPS